MCRSSKGPSSSAWAEAAAAGKLCAPSRMTTSTTRCWRCLLLEENGLDFTTTDVARAWLRLLPAGATWTAERAAYRTLL